MGGELLEAGVVVAVSESTSTSGYNVRVFRRLTVAALLALTSVLSFRALGDAPIYLGGDEAVFATHAASIAATGADLSGARFPLFVHVTDSPEANSVRWYQPTLFYLTAVVLKVAPFTEASVRIPAALIAVIDVWMMYVVASRLLPTAHEPLLAVALLALTPAHFIFGRQALDYLGPLPFVLGWLWCLTIWIDSGRPSAAALAGLVLGVGVYSYIAAWIIMPTLVLLTWSVELAPPRRSASAVLATGLGFALPLLVLAWWLASHPAMLHDTIGRYRIYDERHLTPLQRVKEFLSYNNIQERLSVYWDYFNPAFLFFSGGSNLTTSTRKAGVFLWPMLVLLPVGIYALWDRRRPIDLVLLAGFAVSPLPAVLVGERYAVQRELVIVVFGALISASGAAWLVRQRSGVVRAACVCLLLATPLAYGAFLRDYFGDYQRRSAYWFDPVNFRGVASRLFALDAAGHLPALFLSRDLDDVESRWRFALTKERRLELLARTHYVDPPLAAETAATGSVFVGYANDPRWSALAERGELSLIETIVSAGGAPAAVILRKTR